MKRGLDIDILWMWFDYIYISVFIGEAINNYSNLLWMKYIQTEKATIRTENHLNDWVDMELGCYEMIELTMCARGIQV